MYDTVITGGTIVDGTGAKAYAGDIAIKDGRIAEIGSKVSGEAKQRIDADGAIVTPGFVDVHSHYDGQATWDDKIDPSFSNGITTTVMGNCGVGFAPARPQDRDHMIAVMEGVEDIPGIVLQEGVPWEWETFPEYMEFLSKRKFGVDLGTFVPHAPIRVFAMGERAVRHEQATAEDIAIMQDCVREAMAAGALGVSAGRIIEHMYGPTFEKVPGTFAEKDELIALATAMAESGRGIFQVVPRGAIGGMVDGVGLPREERIAEHGLYEEIARASGRPVHYLLQQFDTDPDDWKLMLGETARARAEGLQIYAHFAARGFGMLAQLEGFHPFGARPSYQAIAHLPIAERAAAMREPARRAAILSETDLGPEEVGYYVWGMGQSMVASVDNFFLYSSESMDLEPGPEQSVGAVAGVTGKPAIEIVYDHMTAGEGEGVAALLRLNYSNGNLDHVHSMLQNPHALSSLGDGGAHVRIISDVTMVPAHLSFWARDRKRGPTLPLEEMVRKITSANAEAYGMNDRGTLEVGKRADINVIDFQAMKISVPKVVHDLPAGGSRFDQKTSGFLATLLNGVVTRERDTDTGARPGRLLRSDGFDGDLAIAAE